MTKEIVRPDEANVPLTTAEVIKALKDNDARRPVVVETEPILDDTGNVIGVRAASWKLEDRP